MGLKFSHNFPHHILGCHRFQIAYRLQQLWLGLVESVLKCHHASDLKGNIIAFNRMHFSVINTYLDIASKGTGQRSVTHFLHDAFLDGTQNKNIDSAADNAIIKSQLSATGKSHHTVSTSSTDRKSGV